MTKQNPVFMVIEDEILLLEAITKKLGVMNINVISCTNGNEAIAKLQEASIPPDAIWLDYYLKDMDGLAFMQRVKENSEWSKIPVFVVSNSASPEKVKTMLALGAKKYLLKAEYHLDDIINMIIIFIRNQTTATNAT